MTILGVLAATMVANLKPAQYRTKALVTKAAKVYEELDQATNMIISECTQTIALNKTYPNCTRTDTPTDMFTGLTPAQMGALYERYMKLNPCGTCNMSSVNKDTKNTAGNRMCYLTKNNANICFYPKDKKIEIDVNNTEGPNSDMGSEDQHSFALDNNGISSPLPTAGAAEENTPCGDGKYWDEGSNACNSCTIYDANGKTCLKCNSASCTKFSCNNYGNIEGCESGTVRTTNDSGASLWTYSNCTSLLNFYSCSQCCDGYTKKCENVQVYMTRRNTCTWEYLVKCRCVK